MASFWLSGSLFLLLALPHCGVFPPYVVDLQLLRGRVEGLGARKGVRCWGNLLPVLLENSLG
jgi:hypothetical protein